MSNIQQNQVICGNCIQELTQLEKESVDMVFADPPYNLQLNKTLYRPDQTRVDAVDDAWDHFSDFKAYDEFTEAWLKAVRPVLKEDGTLWVIGSYHNIYRIGKILQDLGYWVLNDIIWLKSNPMPNFKGTRFTNAHETLLWCAKSKDAKYKFNYKAMKAYNDGKQMRSDWVLPICRGKERITVDGEKQHATQKPESLLQRVILSSTNVGDTILDPFFGTGTTGAVAKYLHRQFIGIDQSQHYTDLAKERIAQIVPVENPEALEIIPEMKQQVRIPFSRLLDEHFLKAGDKLYDKSQNIEAVLHADASLKVTNKFGKKFQGSIHQTSAFVQNKMSANGWTYWYVKKEGQLKLIDEYRQCLLEDLKKAS